MKKIVTIGGGGGHSQVLKGLKRIPGVEITGICPSTDSGGSTGILKKEYDGTGYVGDLTKCVVALCDDPILSKALAFRYENGPLDSHSVKNLLFHALEKVSSHGRALEEIWKICGIGPHKVLPVTNKKTELCARLGAGRTISGETNIDMLAKNPLWMPEVHSIKDIYLKPSVSATPEAVKAVKKADYIVVCPGDLYSSIVPVLLPKGMKKAIAASDAKIVLMLNIMTKKGETDRYTATDFVKAIEKRLGRGADYIVCNDAPIPRHILARYALENKVMLGTLKKTHYSKIIMAPLATISPSKEVLSDPAVIGKVVESIISRER